VRDYLAVVSERAKRPLTERLTLLEEAGVSTVASTNGPLDAIRVAAGLAHGWGVYLLDLDSVTAPVLAWCLARRVPVVLDIGDDAYALARASGASRLSSLPRWLVDAGARRTVTAVVHRGRMHPILRPLPSRSIWCPDTVPDTLLDVSLPVGDPQRIATFGSMGAPDPKSGWMYGREVLDALAFDRRLRGTIVGRGPGVAYVRRLARDRSLDGRLTVLDALPLEDLLDTISAARYVTSYQSSDRAGWVRTTGKLPLVLGSGRALLSSDVGEAAFALPPAWRLTEKRRERFGAAVARRVDELGDADVRATASGLAEMYRRSVVARRLREFLNAL
jgi:hypothetical protein